MKNNFVSILITNYNKSYFLKKTINSCLNQNFNNKSQLLLNIYFDANFVTCTELISGASFNTFSLIPD